MKAFKCDNCETFVGGHPRVSVVARAGREDYAYHIAITNLHQVRAAELCGKCLLEVLEKAVGTCRADIEKED